MKKIFLLIFLFQIIFFVSVPPFQIPDESGHYENVFWLSKGKYPYQLLEKGKVYPSYVNEIEKYYPSNFSFNKIKNNPLKNKKQTDFEKTLPKNFKPINFQSYHPFLYYLLLTPSQFIANLLNVDIITRFYLTRLYSVFLFWLMIFFIYQILRLLKINLNDQKTFLLLYCLNPLLLYYSIGINPDLGVTVFSITLLYFTIKLSKKLSLINLLILGFLSGLCYLSKTSGLFSLLFFAFILFLKEKNFFSFFKKYLTFLIAFVIAVSPWLYLHLSRYQTMSTPSFYIAHEKPLTPHSFFSSIILAFLEFRHTFMHYAGFFGALNQFWPNKTYFIFYTITIVLLFLIGLKNSAKKYSIFVYYLISSFVFFYLLAFYFKKTGFLWDVQGRHFLLAFFPFYFFVYQGLKKILNKKVYIFVKIFSFLNILTFIFFLMLPAFFPNKNIVEELNILYPNFGRIFLLVILGVVIIWFSNTISGFLQVHPND